LWIFIFSLRIWPTRPIGIAAQPDISGKRQAFGCGVHHPGSKPLQTTMELSGVRIFYPVLLTIIEARFSEIGVGSGYVLKVVTMAFEGGKALITNDLLLRLSPIGTRSPLARRQRTRWGNRSVTPGRQRLPIHSGREPPPGEIR
jgi:hypothetical protein